ncbi:MAG TPA: YIP1 family protein [Candidatus Sulfotelmatobacter sp.]|jgi:hypothetical protein|nr:YIP1 family protein [Candidatus Sulfotelmatobacter sp.]
MDYPESEYQSGNVPSNDQDEELLSAQKLEAKRAFDLLLLRRADGFQRVWHMIEVTFQCLPVFKDFFLITSPFTTWSRIRDARHGIGFTFVYYLLPMMFFTAIIEGYGLILVGREQAAEGMNNRFSFPMVCVYETGSLLLLLFFIALAAFFIKSFANACHTRNRVSQSLIVTLHAAGPMLLIQWLNGIPHIYQWLTWFLGAALAVATLYQGLVRIMEPDSPSAMGLFVGSAFTLFMLLLCWKILANFYLAGDLKSVESFFSGFFVKPLA